MSGQKASRPDLLRYYGRMALTLFAVTAAAALLLSLVNGLTGERIAALAEERRQEAMAHVLPGAESFSQLPYDPDLADDLYAAHRGSTLKGYCVQVTADGFGGAMELMVGVDPTGSVTGVEVLSHHETAGVGTRVDDPDFLRSFQGLSGTVSVGSGPNGVDAVSGATVSSRAVARGVTAALAAVADYQAGGGAVDEEGTI